MPHLSQRIIAFIALLMVTGMMLASCAGRVYEVLGAAMEPSFLEGQMITAQPVDPLNLKRGDAVIYQLENGDIHFKRVVGLPGESVRVENGRVYINNQRLDEPYLAADEMPTQQIADVDATHPLSATLAENEYYILGDNRGASYDSRHHGPVTSDSIVGRVKVTLLNRLTTW